MKLAIMQPYFMPYIGYFQLIALVDKFVIYDDVAFINRGWINRNNILINGKASLFTIPLIDASQNRKINEIYILSELKWKSKLLKTFETSYKKAPYFTVIYKLLDTIINAPVEKIGVLNTFAIKAICDYLNIDTEIVESSACYNDEHLKGQDRILDICVKEGADHYINPIGGMELYSKDLFIKNNIQLNFIRSLPFTYKQFANDFVPWLSIIDILMFNSKEDIYGALKQYELV